MYDGNSNCFIRSLFDKVTSPLLRITLAVSFRERFMKVLAIENEQPQLPRAAGELGQDLGASCVHKDG